MCTNVNDGDTSGLYCEPTMVVRIRSFRCRPMKNLLIRNVAGAAIRFLPRNTQFLEGFIGCHANSVCRDSVEDSDTYSTHKPFRAARLPQMFEDILQRSFFAFFQTVTCDLASTCLPARLNYVYWISEHY